MPTNYRKQCNLCMQRVCGGGTYITCPDDVNRQKYACNKCLARAKHPFILAAIAKGYVTRAQVASAAVGETCPKGCPGAAPQECPASKFHQIFSETESAP